MKKLTATIAFLLTCFLGSAQTWAPLGSGTNNWVVSLKDYKNILYVGGNFTKTGADDANNIATWDGTKWTSFATGADYPVSTMEIIKGDLYVGGMFLNIGGIAANLVVKYNGTTWTALGNGVTGVPNSIAEYKGEIYAATLGGIEKWNGTSWMDVGSGLSGFNPFSYALKVYKDELYVGGAFEKAGGIKVNGIAKWNGTNWSTLGKGLSLNGHIFSLEIFNDDLYVGGLYDSINGIEAHCLSKWNGTNWSAVGTGASGGRLNYDTRIDALKTIGNQLYIGGDFNTISGTAASFIASYDGNTFFNLGSGMDNPVYELEEYKGSLIAGGEFSKAGGIIVNNIAKWEVSTGIDNIQRKHDVTVFPNPFNSTTSIGYSNEYEPLDLTIYTIYGQKVKTITYFPEDKIKIERDNIEAGIYFYEINWKDRAFSSGKLIITD